MIRLTDIHKEITEIYKKEKLPWITINLPIDKMQSWADVISSKNNIDGGLFSERVRELFWAVGNVQLSIGYLLICLKDCKYPKGATGIAFSEEQIPNAIGIPELHYRYHFYNSYECLYRTWERITAILKAVCYPKDKEKIYFDGLIDKMKKDDIFRKNIMLGELSKLVKIWNKVAKMRNRYSHHESSLMKSLKIEEDISKLFSPSGKRLPCLKYSYTNLGKEWEELKDLYLRLLPSIMKMKRFVENIGIRELGKRT